MANTEVGAAVVPNPAAAEDLVDRLAKHRTVGSAPRAELEWLAAHGHLERHEPGATVSSKGRPVSAMYIVLAGRIGIHVIRGETRHKLMEWQAGDVTGMLPYSRLGAPPGDTIVEETVEFLAVPREIMPEMIRQCPDLTAILVHAMLDRTRLFTSSELHEQKLKSLGKLAAGLAHELNNPAAAITRFAKTLPDALEAATTASRALGAARMTPSEESFVQAMAAECFSAPREIGVRSALQDTEREDAIAEWLQDHGIDDNAVDLVAQSPVTIPALDRLAASVRPEVLGPALRWMAADCSVRGLASHIDHAGTRISDLIRAVRGFTQVDDVSAAPQPVAIAEGLGQTLTVLGGKARSKSVSVTARIDEPLPRVRAVTAELNQVWANLIDNAIDAAPASGTIEIVARRELDKVVVRVIDNGPGIPDEVRERIFDPFFTTKDVGKGTGLGLDIARRLVKRHDGDLDVRSVPGRTEFIVSLPIADVAAAGGKHE